MIASDDPPIAGGARTGRIAILAGLSAVAIVVLFYLPPIPQDLAYHNFADTKAFVGIPNFLNVVSNVPFAIIGIAGLYWLWKGSATHSFSDHSERWAYIAFFSGVALTSIGSSYYHLSPGNERLAWDRLPMTLGFMGIFAATIGERLNPRLGKWMLMPLLALGAFSVWYWNVTETAGAGDLRVYAFVQFYPLLAIPLMIWFFPARYTKTSSLIVAIMLYGLAKLFESLDAPIYSAGHIVSGHTLKHLISAGAAFWILSWLRARTWIAPSEG